MEHPNPHSFAEHSELPEDIDSWADLEKFAATSLPSVETEISDDDALDLALPADRDLAKLHVEAVSNLDNKVLWNHLDGPADAWEAKRAAMEYQALKRIGDLEGLIGKILRRLSPQKAAVWETAQKTLQQIQAVDRYRLQKKHLLADQEPKKS